MRRRLVTILATTLLVSGIAAAQEPTGSPPEPAGLLSGATVSCSLAVPSWVAGCWLEQAVLTLGAFEVAVGIDVQGDLAVLFAGEFGTSHIAPYAVMAWYGDASSVWVELRLPRLGNVPLIGAADALRIGFSTRLP